MGFRLLLLPVFVESITVSPKKKVLPSYDSLKEASLMPIERWCKCIDCDRLSQNRNTPSQLAVSAQFFN